MTSGESNTSGWPAPAARPGHHHVREKRKRPMMKVPRMGLVESLAEDDPWLRLSLRAVKVPSMRFEVS